MDAATLLEHYTHDLANMPQETQYMLHELQKKDLEYDKILSEIQSADSQLFKYIKQHGSIIRHPKEELLTEEIRKNLDQARKIQNEKVLLANTALLSIAKHAAKFERDIKKLVDSGAIENWDVTENDIEMIDVNMNSTAVPISIGSPSSFSAGTPPVSGDRTTGDVTELTAKFNHSSLDTKIQRPPKKSSRGMTPTSVSSMDDTTLSTKQSAHTRRRDVTAGTIIKGPNRRVIGAVKGLGGNENSGAGEDDELYCFCQQVSYGAMVACDNPNCKYEWFHYECVGLKEPPVGVWFCPDCRKGVKKDPKKEEKKKL